MKPANNQGNHNFIQRWQAREQEIRRLYIEKGLGQRQVADQLGISQGLLSAVMKALTIPQRNRGARKKPYQRDTLVKVIPEPPHCQSCHICIGQGFMEIQAYSIGQYNICGHCLGNLQREGCIAILGDLRGNESVVIKESLWLYPDGTTKEMTKEEWRAINK